MLGKKILLLFTNHRVAEKLWPIIPELSKEVSKEEIVEISKSYNFNGINNFINLPINIAPQLANSDLTIEFWAKISSDFNGYGILYSQGALENGNGQLNISFYKNNMQALTIYANFVGDSKNKR